MKIDPRIPSSLELQNDPVKSSRKSGVRNAPEATRSSEISAGDTVQLSGRHSEVQQLAALVANLPEVRTERVAPLQAKVQSGSYHPDSAEVADAMIAEHSRRPVKG
jgi:flagellar biosynthesis anti-sigma factor FlgM